MTFGLPELQHILDQFCPSIRDKIYIAGGAVRDALLHREPQDIDIFVFGGLQAVTFNGHHVQPTVIHEYFDKNGNLTHNRNGDVWELKFEGRKLQFISAHEQGKNIQELLQFFDLNICCFAYGPNGLEYHTDPATLHNRIIRLHSGAFRNPKRCFQRAVNFVHRYDFDFPISEIRKLAKFIRNRKFELKCRRAALDNVAPELLEF